MKDIAVIMSVYKNDRLEFLIQAVDSILTQTYEKFDFYIQCDGLIDSKCDEYLNSLTDERVIIRYRDKNKGLAFSLNEILEITLSQYQYFARMDADDISLPDRFEKQLLFLNDNKNVDCVGTWAIEIDEEGEEYFRKEMPVDHNACFKLFEKRDCLIHPTVMFRNTYFRKAGLYPLHTYFGEDTIMWMQGFANGCIFANINEYLFKFRLDNAFFDRRRGWKHAKSIIKLRSQVNRTLKYGWKADVFMYMYAAAKMLPTQLLNLVYKSFR